MGQYRKYDSMFPFDQAQMSAPEPQAAGYSPEASKSNMVGDVVQGAATGATIGGPGAAAVMAGGAFLNSYLQAKAAEEQQKRALMVQAAQQQGQGEQNALSNLIGVARGFRT